MHDIILLDEIKAYIDAMQTGIKKVQRGVSTGATTINIDAVDMSKAFVVSTSKGSAGYVAARGMIAPTVVVGSVKMNKSGYAANEYGTSYEAPLSGNISGTSLSSGSTDLTTKQYSAKLISSTQIKTDGACEWQVIEFM